MGKLMLFLSFIGLTLLTIGTTLAPQNPIFWLASNNMNYEYLRFGLLVIISLQLITQPPRRLGLRLLTGLMALVTVVWTVQATYAYHMQFLDTLLFLQAGVVLGLTALESRASDLSLPLPNTQLNKS